MIDAISRNMQACEILLLDWDPNMDWLMLPNIKYLKNNKGTCKRKCFNKIVPRYPCADKNSNPYIKQIQKYCNQENIDTVKTGASAGN